MATLRCHLTWLAGKYLLKVGKSQEHAGKPWKTYEIMIMGKFPINGDVHVNGKRMHSSIHPSWVRFQQSNDITSQKWCGLWVFTSSIIGDFARKNMMITWTDIMGIHPMMILRFVSNMLTLNDTDIEPQ